MLNPVGCLWWDLSVLIEQGYQWPVVSLENKVVTIQVGVEPLHSINAC